MDKLSISVRLYQFLLAKTDEATASEAISLLEENIKDEVNQQTKSLATREEIIREISTVKTDLIKWFVGFFLTLVLMIIGLYLKK